MKKILLFLLFLILLCGSGCPTSIEVAIAYEIEITGTANGNTIIEYSSHNETWADIRIKGRAFKARIDLLFCSSLSNCSKATVQYSDDKEIRARINGWDTRGGRGSYYVQVVNINNDEDGLDTMSNKLYFNVY